MCVCVCVCVIEKMECLAEIKNITNDMLKLNDDKTELFVFAQRQVDAFKGLNINIGNSSVHVSS